MRSPPIIPLALALLGLPSLAAGQDSPRDCLEAARPLECLRTFEAGSDGLDAAYRDLGLQAVADADLATAATALQRAESRFPELRGLTLWAAQYREAAGPGPLQSIRSRHAASTLLNADSLDPGANLLIGTQDAREIVRRSRRAAVSSEIAEAAMMTRQEAMAASGTGVRFSDRYRDALLDVSVAEDDEEAPIVRRTVRRLRTASEWPPTARWAIRQLALVHVSTDAFEELSEDAARYRSAYPEDPLGYLLGALAAIRQDRVDAAATLADIGLSQMTAAERDAVLDPGRVMSTAQTAPVDIPGWWREQDPIALTAVNERLAEHVARWIYADIRYGNPYTGARGVDTDPGAVILRYGIPSAEIQFTGETDRFAIFEYPGFDFRFMSLARRGSWSFFAPSATAFQGGRRVNPEVWAADYVVAARERFRDMPSRMEPIWEEFPLRAALFRAETGLDVLAVGAVPEGMGMADRGAMVLDGQNRILSYGDERIPGWEESRTFIKPMHVPRVGVDPYVVRVEAVAPSRLTAPPRTAVLLSEPQAAPHPTGLSLSSVLLADLIEEDNTGATEPGVWLREGLRISPSHDGVYDGEAPVYAYFEVYGLQIPPGGEADFQVTASLSPVGETRPTLLGRLLGRGDDSVGAGFRSASDTADIGQYLLLERQSRRPGDYLLTLSIEDRVTGTTVETTTGVRFN